MSDLDLNLDNYSLMELLNLFHLNKIFDEKDLKKAKIMALKTHPDKSGLEEKIFIFFKDAYDRIERIYNFRARSQSKRYNDSYTKMMGDVTNVGERELLKKVHGKSVKEFNNWFNEMYESHVKMKDLEKETGYTKWFKSDEDVEKNTNVSLNEFGDYFNDKKRRQRALVIHKGVEDMYMGSGGSNLNSNNVESYSSGMFSKLPYEDLKRAHTETVVPVTKEDFENRKKYNNVNELKEYRKNQKVEAYSEKQSKMLLEKKRDMESEMAVHTAYNLMKESEAAERSNNDWWKSLKQLGNK
tara:strand:- start:2349 stop:3242 length:894 start_codon:yes stop_codon:yes gene_type:complete